MSTSTAETSPSPLPDLTVADLAARGPRLAELLAHIAQDASARDLERAHPWEAVELLRRSRFGALRVPVAEGGGGLTLRELIEVVVDLGAADSNVAHIVRNHFHFGENVLRQPDPAKRAKWIRVLVSGELVGLASGELGAHPTGESRYATRLRSTAGGLVLDGTKYYCTGTLYADWVSVTAGTDDGTPVTVVVPTDRAGVTRLDDWDGIGQRLTGTGTTRFDQVAVDESEVVPRPGGGSNNFAHHSTFPGLFLTAVQAGILRSGIDDAVAYLRRRQRTFATAPDQDPRQDALLQSVVGRIASTAFVARSAVLLAAEALDVAADSVDSQGVPDPAATHEAELRASQAKVFVDEAATQAASALLDVGGASGTQRRHNLDRHWRNIRTLASHNPALYRARAIGDLEINGTSLPAGILTRGA